VIALVHPLSKPTASNSNMYSMFLSVHELQYLSFIDYCDLTLLWHFLENIMFRFLWFHDENKQKLNCMKGIKPCTPSMILSTSRSLYQLHLFTPILPILLHMRPSCTVPHHFQLFLQLSYEPHQYQSLRISFRRVRPLHDQKRTATIM
jgi:hypothetical protein